MKHNRILAVVLVLALVVGIVPAHAADVSPFADVPTTHWAYPYVREAHDNGVINGTAPGVFLPNGVLTAAEFSVILARAYYADEVERKTRTNWYNREVQVLDEHHVFDMENVSMPKPEMSQPLKRYEMARMIWGVMRDQGAAMPSAGELEAAKAGISDISTVPLVYRDCVAVCFSLGIINGTAPGVFSGEATMQRDAAAAVYCRTKAAIAGEKPGTVTPDPVPSTEPEPTPSTPVTPPVTGSVAGTMSTEKVTISKDSIKTHAPITDYWSSQPAEIQAIADKDYFNAACQTIKDTELMTTQGELLSTGVNPYYNYAVVATSESQGARNVTLAMGNLSAKGCTFLAGGNSGYMFRYARPLRETTTSAPRFASTIASLTPDMSDRAVAEACLNSVCAQLDYVVNGGASWDNSGTEGDCASFSRMLTQLLSAAGIPNFHVAGNVKNSVYQGGHAWVLAKLDGAWMCIDGVSAERGNGGIFTIAEHEARWGYSGTNDSNSYRVGRALVDIFF